MNITDPQYQHCLASLRQSPFFAGLSSDTQKDILSLLHFERAQPYQHTRVFDAANELFHVVVSGRAKVAACNPDTGREHILYLLGPGDGFDMVCLLDGQPHEVTATALEAMEVLTAPLTHVRRWLSQHPDFNRTLLPYIGAQMRQLSEQVVDLSLYDTETRLAHLILRHLTSKSPVHGLSLINDLSQEALAAMIGSVRVVVTAHMQNWKKLGILSGGRGQWRVNNMLKLLDKAKSKFNLPA